MAVDSSNIVVVGGGGRLFVCADRSGRDAREIPALPGHVILKRGPGFGGSETGHSTLSRTSRAGA